MMDVLEHFVSYQLTVIETGPKEDVGQAATHWRTEAEMRRLRRRHRRRRYRHRVGQWIQRPLYRIGCRLRYRTRFAGPF